MPYRYIRLIITFALFTVNWGAHAAPVFESYALESPSELLAKSKQWAMAHNLKWIRQVSLEQETGTPGLSGWVLYVCDIHYMAKVKELDETAGLGGPCKIAIMPFGTGSRVLMQHPQIRNQSAPDTLALSFKMRNALGALASNSVTEVDFGVPPPGSWIYRKKSSNQYPELMLNLQNNLVAAGLALVRVQHMDLGLRSKGYPSLPYKILYVTGPINIDYNLNPELSLFVPIPILVYEDENGNGSLASGGTAIARGLVRDSKAALALADLDTRLAIALDNLD